MAEDREKQPFGSPKESAELVKELSMPGMLEQSKSNRHRHGEMGWEGIL